jgi:hypothetical protein
MENRDRISLVRDLLAFGVGARLPTRARDSAAVLVQGDGGGAAVLHAWSIAYIVAERLGGGGPLTTPGRRGAGASSSRTPGRSRARRGWGAARSPAARRRPPRRAHGGGPGSHGGWPRRAASLP